MLTAQQCVECVAGARFGGARPERGVLFCGPNPFRFSISLISQEEAIQALAAANTAGCMTKAALSFSVDSWHFLASVSMRFRSDFVYSLSIRFQA